MLYAKMPLKREHVNVHIEDQISISMFQDRGFSIHLCTPHLESNLTLATEVRASFVPPTCRCLHGVSRDCMAFGLLLPYWQFARLFPCRDKYLRLALCSYRPHVRQPSFDMLLLPLLVSLLLALSARSEKFTALVELGESVSVESEIADLLDLYAERESQRIENVRRYAADLRAHAELMQKVNAETYLANPVNAFLTTARFTTKLQRQLNSLVHDRSAEQALNEELEFRKDRMPNEVDLSGATEALLRLQDTYKIPAQLLARGLVHQSQNIPFSEMSGEYRTSSQFVLAANFVKRKCLCLLNFGGRCFVFIQYFMFTVILTKQAHLLYTNVRYRSVLL